MNKKTPSLFKQSVTAHNNWHSQDIEQVLKKLNSSYDGLSIEEARRRLSEFGPNRLPEIKSRGALQRFLYQFHNVLIYVLLVACAITTILGHFLDASVIFGVIIVNAIIGFVQEGKAENALKAIRQMLSPQAMVLREGLKTVIETLGKHCYNETMITKLVSISEAAEHLGE
jgi:magnesium-transporting ATPase (P-type)